MASIATPSIKRCRVPLETNLFNEALASYLDETKPDPLVTKQVRGWTCGWTEVDDKTLSSNDGIESNACRHGINGTLALHGDHVTIIIHADCQWTWENETGSLEFKLGIRARFRTKSELKRDATAAVGEETKVDKKVRAGVLKRLKQDDYVQKILTDDFIPLCQATVLIRSSSELEERVWMDQDLLESIRRSVYSHENNLISVVEMLTCLPYCRTPDCPLGHRAKLRLLEDAMLDACDREGEEELIDELSLQSSTTKTDEVSTVEKMSEHVTKKKKDR